MLVSAGARALGCTYLIRRTWKIGPELGFIVIGLQLLGMRGREMKGISAYMPGALVWIIE